MPKIHDTDLFSQKSYMAIPTTFKFYVICMQDMMLACSIKNHICLSCSLNFMSLNILRIWNIPHLWFPTSQGEPIHYIDLHDWITNTIQVKLVGNIFFIFICTID